MHYPYKLFGRGDKMKLSWVLQEVQEYIVLLVHSKQSK